jgi:hypothetical protein
MAATLLANRPGYAIIIIGLVLVCMSAVVPFYDDGYRLRATVLIAGLLPYLVYAIIVNLLQDNITIVAGILLLAAHIWLVWRERFVGSVDYSDGAIYYIPLVFTLLLLPLLFKALRRPWRKQAGLRAA